jgi:mono/diheme cytochrome c family protein
MRSRPARSALLLLLIAAGCGTVKSPTEPLSEPPGGATAFTFAQIQREIFTPTCAKAGCHDAASASEGLVLAAGQSYGLLVGHPATENGSLNRVEPGDPERSYIILKLRGDPRITGARMPLDGPPYLSPEQIEGIAAWIRAGAPNN